MPSGLRADLWAHAVRAYPHGIPVGARLRAEHEISVLASKQRHVESITGSWAPIGPSPILNGQSWPGQGTSVASGRATVVAANPNAPHGQFWLGTASGGLWRRDANTTTWVPMTDLAPSMAIGAIALDNCDANGCNTVYVGTGEDGFRRDTYYGAGVFKLTNMDTIWTAQVLGGSIFGLGAVQKLLIDPSSPATSRTIYVALSKGETSNAADGSLTAPAPSQGFGIYKSTNGGTSFASIGPNVGGAPAVDLIMDPKDSAVLYAAFGDSGIYKTTNGGASWAAFNAGIPSATVTGTSRPALAISHDAAAAAVLYAVMGVNCGSPHMHGSPYGGCIPSFFRITDSGTPSWQLMPATTVASIAPSLPTTYGGALFQYPDYTHAMVIVPNTNAQTIVFGGVDLWKSTDGGNTFSADPSVIGNDGIHPDYHQLVLPDPTNPSYILATNDGGLYSSTDGGVTWASENDFLGITEFQSIAVSSSGGSVVGGTQDNGTNLFNGFLAWERQDGGDSASAFFDVDHPNTMYDVYTDVDPRRIQAGLQTKDILNGLNTSDPVAFYPPMVQAQTGSAPHPVYFGTNQVYRTSDISQTDPTWAPVSPALGGTSTYYPDIDSTNVITAIGIAPSAPTRIYVGYYDGQIWVTDAASTSTGAWRSVGGSSNGLPNRAVTSIAVDPDSKDVAYVTFSGFGSLSGDPGDHVFATANGGGSWQTISTGLSTSDPANVIVVEKGPPKRLWLGTDHGVFLRAASGGSWARSNGLPLAPVYALATDEARGRIYAGTHGRGAWVVSSTPIVKTFEGWVNGSIWDIPTYGSGFFPNQTCTDIAVVLQDGTVCAEGSIDAQGSTISTDANGQIVTSNGSRWSGKPVAWACYDSKCVNNTPIGSCNKPGNPISTVRVTCGNQVVTGSIGNCPASGNPPSTGLGLKPLSTGSASMAFALFATVQSGDGSTRSLCSAQVPFTSTEADDVILRRAAGALTSSPACGALSVSAAVLATPTGQRTSEDGESAPARLTLQAPTITGSQLFTGVRTAPGQATGVCFAVAGMGLAPVESLLIPKLSFDAGSGTAAGGDVRVTERSFIGDCAVTVPTTAGESVTSVASAVQAAFSGSSAQCPATSNLNDTRVDSNTLTFVAAREIVVCIDDAGLGMSLRPEEIVLNRPPVCANEGVTANKLLEPVDGRMVPESDLDTSDPDHDPLTYQITTITQDEPTAGVTGFFDTGPDGTIGSFFGIPIADLRAENEPFGNGRVYKVTYTATDPFGASCTGSWEACAPNALLQCVDDGQNYDSTKP